MKTKINNCHVKIFWRYGYADTCKELNSLQYFLYNGYSLDKKLENFIKKREKELLPERYTVCVIQMEGTNLVLASEISYCSNKDNFSKNTGRLISLSAAIKELDKKQQKLIIDTYFLC